jgi:tRNA(Ile)-lysidine synthase
LGVLEQLLNHVERHQLCKTTDKILLAVSGGVDSMVLLHLLHEARFTIAVVHCNFQLRGQDSDADELLVQIACSAKAIPFYTIKFETEAFARQHGLSIQMAARKLRYDFFQKVRAENRYDFIATAHQLNDSLETVLLNFTRGTGINGIAGIPVKNDFVIRPLLFATRDEILEYAALNKIQWREDASNAEDKYQRNFIRHKIIPLLEEINPNLEKTFQNSVERLSGAIEMAGKYLADFKSGSVVVKPDGEWISRGDLMQHAYPETLLWELLKKFGYNFEQCRDAVETKQSGKLFLTTTHRLVVDREHFILSARDSNQVIEVLIESFQDAAHNGRELLSIKSLDSALIEIDKTSSSAQVDASKLKFPLRWRAWQPGDSFKPLGMNAHKKISDLLIDLKVPASQKATVTVLESAGKIVWVVGLRVSDEFKITTETTSALSFNVAKTDL